MWKKITAAVFAAIIIATSAFAQTNSPGPLPLITAGKQWKTYAILGDSFASNAGSSAAAQPCNSSCGSAISGNYFTWADLYMASRIYRNPNTTSAGLVTNCGISGATSAGILANVSCVLAVKPDLVIMESGTNDAVASIACATTTANNRAMYAQLASAGIFVIKAGVIPRSGGSAYTTAQANLAQCYNEYDRRYQEEVGSQGFLFVDLDPVVIDPASPTTWSIRSNFLIDGVHPSTNGGSVMGLTIAQAVNQLISPWRAPVMTNGDVFDATNNPVGNLVSNGVFTGTGGSSFNGCSGVVPTGYFWGATATTGGATCVASATTLADGRPALVLTISGASTGSNNKVVLRTNNITAANVVSGDTIEGQAWVSFGPNSNIAGVSLTLSTTESSVGFSNLVASSTPTDPLPASGLAGNAFVPLVTPRRTTGANPSAVFMDLAISPINGSVSPSITVIVAGMSVKKVLQ